MRKTCPKCGAKKPIEKFYRDRSSYNGHDWQCIVCRKRKQRKYRKNTWWASDLKLKYNLTENEWREFFERQDGRCAICGKHQSILSRRLSVDHDHKTGIVRGLLCGHCNYCLSIFDNYTDTLRDYLNL